MQERSSLSGVAMQRGPWIGLLAVAALTVVLCLGVLVWRPKQVGWQSEYSIAPKDVKPVKVNLGQLYVCGLKGTDLDEETKTALQRGMIAGLVLTGRNLSDKDQVRRLCRAVYLAVPQGEPPPILCVEQEGGELSRLSALGVPDWGAAKYLRRHGVDGTRDYADKVGQFVSGLFLNVNLAPDLDVASNPRNPMTVTRSLSGDPAEVAKYGTALIQGFQGSKVKAVGKFFPGRGGATGAGGDTGRPVVELGVEELRSTHIAPFVECWRAGLDAVMVPHVTYKSLDSSRPASRSPKVVTGLLRGELGFGGVVWCEDIAARTFLDQEMRIEDAATQALGAGVDILLDTRPYSQATLTLVELRHATSVGKLDQDQLAQSVQRVRNWRGMLPDLRK